MTNNELAKLVQQGDKQAREQMILNNMGLVGNMVNKLRVHSIDRDDQMQYGYEALIKAVDTFDINNGAQFTSYASIFIRNEIIRRTRQDISQIRVPEYWHYRGRKKLEENKFEVLSLSTEYYTDSEDLKHLSDFIEDKEAQKAFEDAEHTIDHEILHNKLNNIISKFKPNQQEYIKMKYGYYGEPMNQREIAKEWGLTFQRVSQIAIKAEQRLKRYRSKLSDVKELLV